jgi:hypothetical protein
MAFSYIGAAHMIADAQEPGVEPIPFDFNQYMVLSDAEHDGDESMLEPLDLAGALATPLKFGRFKDQTLATIASSIDGWSYLEYLMTWEELKSRTRAAITLVLENQQCPPADLGDAMRYQLKFGKYKGKTLASVITTKVGRDYFRYLHDWPNLNGATKRYVDTVYAALENWSKKPKLPA